MGKFCVHKTALLFRDFSIGQKALYASL